MSAHPTERPRSRLPRPARRAQVLAAAREVFAAQGYHAAAMDDIAERAGVSKPVLYQHFPGKLDLYLALVDQQAGELVDAVHAALATTLDNRERVARTMAAYLDFVDGDGAHRLLFESDLLGEPAVEELVGRSLQACVSAIADTIAADTGVDQEEAQLLSVGLSGLAQVAARWWLTAGTGVSKERAVELLSGLAWRGISGSPRRLQ
ncbi:MAG: TetR/AcrR family transcriptional regulator [Mycobacteriales bacterium]